MQTHADPAQQPVLVLRGEGFERELRAGRFYTVGRSVHADIQIHHPMVSRRHLVIGYNGGWFVEDLGSRNGIFVGGRRVEREPLGGPTELRIGNPLTGAALLLMPGDVATASPGAASPLTHSGELTRAAFARLLAEAPAPPLLREPITAASQRTARIAPQPVHAGSVSVAPHSPQPLPNGPQLATAGRGLQIRNLGFAVEGGKQLLRDISIDAGIGTLTAIVGPSGAGKSTFAKTVAGLNTPTQGTVSFDGVDVHQDYSSAKSLIGMVPQEDVIHTQLKLLGAIRYAAQLRFGSDHSAADREAHVQRAMTQLDLGPHAKTRISKLSGGQRKRASVALELLTEPSLLILDEPTSGLDPALDRQLMREFRSLADGGRTVLTITHSVACLELCDTVLVLAPGGAPAFVGSEAEAWEFFGTTDWSEIFERLKNSPEACGARWAATEQARRLAQPVPYQPASAAARNAPLRPSRFSQFGTLMRRQFSLMLSDRGYTAFLIALPFVIGLLPVVVPGETGLGQVQRAKNAQEPQMILTLLMIGAVFMGISMSIRDLVGERSIFLRERAVDLSTSAYIAAKLVVYNLLGVYGAIVIVWVSGRFKELPEGAGVLGFRATTELTISLALTISIGVVIGIVLSALVNSQNQIMPVMIVVLMVQMVLNGGLIPLADNAFLNSISTAVPTRWTLALGANSIDLPHLLEIADEAERQAVADTMPDPDPMWERGVARWYLSFSVLTVMAGALTFVAWLRTRTRSS